MLEVQHKKYMCGKAVDTFHTCNDELVQNAYCFSVKEEEHSSSLNDEDGDKKRADKRQMG